MNIEEAAYIFVMLCPTDWNDVVIRGARVIPGNMHDHSWQPVIEIETGKITNWKKGVYAEVFYEVFDENSTMSSKLSRWKVNGKVIDARCVWTFYDKDLKAVSDSMYGFVPNFLFPSPENKNRINLTIDEEGFILNWNKKLLFLKNETE